MDTLNLSAENREKMHQKRFNIAKLYWEGGIAPEAPRIKVPLAQYYDYRMITKQKSS